MFIRIFSDTSWDLVREYPDATKFLKNQKRLATNYAKRIAANYPSAQVAVYTNYGQENETYTIMTDTLTSVIKKYPKSFSLRAFPSRNFRIAPPPISYISPDLGIQLVVQIDQRPTSNGWLDFSRCTPSELDGEII